MSHTTHKIDGYTITISDYPSDGFQLTVWDTDLEEVYDARMVGYSYYEAIMKAEWLVTREGDSWADRLGYEYVPDEDEE